VYPKLDTHVNFRHSDRARDTERLPRFEREAKTLAALNHPHIVATHDSQIVAMVAILAGMLAVVQRFRGSEVP